MTAARVRPILLRLALVAASSVLVVACSSSQDDGSNGEDSAPSEETVDQAEALSGGTSITLYYLGSSSFLRHCAGSTLGCGRSVSSVPDSHPYFSAPWSTSRCNDWYTFRHDGHCVEAQRLEVSDSHGFIEGNPGLFNGLHLHHTDGSCSSGGSGTYRGVKISSGRHCG